MGTLDHNFNGISAKKAKSKAEKPKYPPPFSICFTLEERARFDAERGRSALSAHIRECLFGDDVTPRRKSGKSPVKDSEALGRLLGALGGSRLSNNLNQLAKAVNTNSLSVTQQTEADIVAACEDIKALRANLLRALGKSPGASP